MTFGQKIKALRRAQDMTQEQLAEALSISPQAVSRWETDGAMPDISLLPQICHMFDVTSDELLGIDLTRTNEKIAEYLKAEREAAYAGDFERSLRIMQEAHRQFPRSFEIKERLANAWVNVLSRKGEKDYDEPIRLLKDVLAGCTDSMLRYKALDLLGTAYSYAGNTEEMRKIAEQMPPFSFCRESFMLYRIDDTEEGLKQRQEYLSSLVTDLLTSLHLISCHRCGGELVFSIDERMAIWKQIVTVVETLYPDGDYQFKAQEAEIPCAWLMGAYLRRGDTENALYWLEKGCDFAMHFDTYDFDAPHTSPAFRGYSDGGWIPEAGGNHSANLLEYLTENKETEPIRTDPRVTAIIGRLQQTAKMT